MRNTLIIHRKYIIVAPYKIQNTSKNTLIIHGTIYIVNTLIIHDLIYTLIIHCEKYIENTLKIHCYIRPKKF